VSDIFIDILRDVKVIKVKEPLAEILGAFKIKDAVVGYTFIDTVKMAGHVCPTIASAYVCCQEALKKDIAHHLVEAESHHQREEEALFTRLEGHNIGEPVAVMKSDHIDFRSRKQELYKLIHNWQSIEFENFKRKILEIGEYLVRELENHIFKEDNILYQIALQVLNEKEWEEIKRDCDKIGYCCFTPADQKTQV